MLLTLLNWILDTLFIIFLFIISRINYFIEWIEIASKIYFHVPEYGE